MPPLGALFLLLSVLFAIMYIGCALTYRHDLMESKNVDD